jgi:hypothetical protein
MVCRGVNTIVRAAWFPPGETLIQCEGRLNPEGTQQNVGITRVPDSEDKATIRSENKRCTC